MAALRRRRWFRQPPCPRQTAAWSIACRKRFATWALLVTCACLSPWPHGAGAAEINAATTARPAGFADIVAEVKPAVIAVTVRLESDAQVSDTDEAPSQSRPSPRTHRSIATSSAILSSGRSLQPLGKSKRPWGLAFSYLRMGTR